MSCIVHSDQIREWICIPFYPIFEVQLVQQTLDVGGNNKASGNVPKNDHGFRRRIDMDSVLDEAGLCSRIDLLAALVNVRGQVSNRGTSRRIPFPKRILTLPSL
jgi:hypothetical protein